VDDFGFLFKAQPAFRSRQDDPDATRGF
jgi:hypothetical protein